MLTHGGVFAEAVSCREFVGKLSEKMPVLSSERMQRYRIERFELTDKERGLFDRAATEGGVASSEGKALARLGFEKGKIGRYRELLRYYPRYVETMV